MKKYLCIILTLVLVTAALSSCAPQESGSPDSSAPATSSSEPTPTLEPTPTIAPTPTPTPSATVSEAIAICERAGITTGANGYHGGHQPRICHTDHGTYIAFVSYESGGKYYFYIVKTDADNNATVLYQDWCPYDAALVNVAADTNGDVYVATFPINKLNGGTIPEKAWLALYRIDAETDKVTEYKKEQQMGAISANGFGYSQPVFDFENRKIYAMYNGGNKPGMLSWFTFDMNDMKWLDSNYTVQTDILRHAYMYCFPDGNGGVVIVANRDIPVELVDLEFKPNRNPNKPPRPKYADYVWDQLDMIVIPDLTKESYSSIVIHEADYSRGSEGIAPNVTNNQLGDAFMDADGRLHILYTVRMLNYNLYNGDPDGIISEEMRHAIYEGTKCVYNEPINFAITDANMLKKINYAMRMAQSKSGNLYIFAVPMDNRSAPRQIEIYRATDALGTEFVRESITEFENIEDAIMSFSISCPRNGSVQDDVIDCMLFRGGDEIYTFKVKIY